VGGHKPTKAEGAPLGLSPILGQTAYPGTLKGGFVSILRPLSGNRAF